jgi:hypothetical protein
LSVEAFDGAQYEAVPKGFLQGERCLRTILFNK